MQHTLCMTWFMILTYTQAQFNKSWTFRFTWFFLLHIGVGAQALEAVKQDFFHSHHSSHLGFNSHGCEVCCTRRPRRSPENQWVMCLSVCRKAHFLYVVVLCTDAETCGQVSFYSHPFLHLFLRIASSGVCWTRRLRPFACSLGGMPWLARAQSCETNTYTSASTFTFTCTSTSVY